MYDTNPGVRVKVVSVDNPVDCEAKFVYRPVVILFTVASSVAINA